MKNRELLAIILLSLSFCFVSRVAYGEVDQESAISALTVTRAECLLLCAKADYMVGNPTSFLDIDLDYDLYGYLGNLMKWPIEIDTEGKIIVRIRDSRNLFLNKSGVVILELFKEELEVVCSFIEYIAPNMNTDIVARFHSKSDIPIGYFYQGEYHLWEE